MIQHCPRVGVAPWSGPHNGETVGLGLWSHCLYYVVAWEMRFQAFKGLPIWISDCGRRNTRNATVQSLATTLGLVCCANAQPLGVAVEQRYAMTYTPLKTIARIYQAYQIATPDISTVPKAPTKVPYINKLTTLTLRWRWQLSEPNIPGHHKHAGPRSLEPLGLHRESGPPSP